MANNMEYVFFVEQFSSMYEKKGGISLLFFDVWSYMPESNRRSTDCESAILQGFLSFFRAYSCFLS